MSIQIEIGGEVRGLVFNNFAFNAARKKIVPDMIEETSGYAFFWGGLVAALYVEGRIPVFTFSDTMTWYDTLTEEQGIEIANAIKESQAYKDNVKPEDQPEDNGDEKKNTMTMNTGETVNALPLDG